MDEEITVMRLYMNKMKTEAKSLQSRVHQLEEERVQNIQLMRRSEEESKVFGIRVRELEVKLLNLTDKANESESRRRQLQDTVDSLNSEVAMMRANEQLLSGAGASNQQILAGQSEIREKLDEEFKRQSEQYAHQTKQLRAELDARDKRNEELKDEVEKSASTRIRKHRLAVNRFDHLSQVVIPTLDTRHALAWGKARIIEEGREFREVMHQLTGENSRLTFQMEKVSEENKNLREQLESTFSRLEILEKEQVKSDQAKQDLRGLEETIAKELNSLTTLRHLFLQNLRNRVKKGKTRQEERKMQKSFSVISTTNLR
ncbi:unnamed protein product [Dibothriocephalus latus]|uniref:Uncharacterized protein n=1 Tax=Dibothriocephalus latus TaxID=60516 RepID=A0A3P7P904_DIBLA|nr:unnamed protein product [Dibothriocephalus latus]